MAQGKRAGTRQRTGFRPVLLALALGITLSVVAWGYLVLAAVDFGKSARDGEDHAWYFLVIASLGAVACLFVGLILLARLSRTLGITRAPQPKTPRDPSMPAAGRRAAR